MTTRNSRIISRRKLRKRSSRKNEEKEYHCKFLNKNFNKKELIDIILAMGGKITKPSDYTEDDLCYIIEREYPESVNYLRYLFKSYIGLSFKTLVILLAVAFMGGNVPSSLQKLGIASVALSVFAPATLSLFFPVAIIRLLTTHSTVDYALLSTPTGITVWHIIFAKQIYKTYKTRKVINARGKTVHKVIGKNKMEVDLDY